MVTNTEEKGLRHNENEENWREEGKSYRVGEEGVHGGA